jgi:hypothetical protein
VKKTFGEKVVAFNKKLKFSGNLPEGFEVMNPFFDNPETIAVMSKFYQKFYNDYHQRKFIIGINPSRRGAGVTGVPFTDTKRLETVCGIEMKTAHTHEISSVFLYDVIENFGGVEAFYKKFYINSPFPLAIIRKTLKGNLNANYYDDKDLFEAVKPFMIQSLKDHIDLGLDTSEVFILGKKNATFIDKINSQEKFFEKMTVLEHPRYIQQYKIKEKQLYIDKYLIALNKAI